MSGTSQTTESRVEEIRQRWENHDTEPQCGEWWYAAIRHLDRNVDGLCAHERDEEEDGDGNLSSGGHNPDRREGEAYSHASSDIHYLLSLLDRNET